jgi:hypothetical protein
MTITPESRHTCSRGERYLSLSLYVYLPYPFKAAILLLDNVLVNTLPRQRMATQQGKIC